MKTIC